MAKNIGSLCRFAGWLPGLLLLAVLSPMPLHAEPNPPLPDMLKKDGKPLDAYCFNELTGEQADSKLRIETKTCGRPKTITIVKMAEVPDYGYEYSEKDDETGDVTENELIQYRYFGMAGDAMTLLITWSGGGSGVFTDVYTLRRTGDALTLVKDWGGGDRCNGGVTDVTIEKGKPVIERNVTPADFLTMVPGANPRHFQASGDLDASAISCVGTATVRDGVTTGFTPDMDYIEGLATQPSSDRAPAQTCFDKVMAGIASGKTWTRPQITEFMQHFNRICAGVKPAEEKDE